MCLVIPIILWVVNKGRKKAITDISKTEAEVYKTLVENKLADLNLSDIIEQKVELAIKKFKDMLWDQQEEHYKVKLDMQDRLMSEVKEKQEILREKQLLANEHKDCQFQIDMLRKELEQIKKNL